MSDEICWNLECVKKITNSLESVSNLRLVYNQKLVKKITQKKNAKMLQKIENKETNMWECISKRHVSILVWTH